VINEHLASCYSWGTTSRNISNSAIRQVTKHACDRQTDRRADKITTPRPR